ncbi:MAG: phospholipid carrier-dependent glycosyltransferase [Bdellovibrionales bacterium]|nr:phospholipid carrier-dependent glycosyltransferase [Bdellovibrionales bacterium]
MMSKALRYALHLILWLSILWLYLGKRQTHLEQPDVKGDATGYVTMAYNFVHSDVLSKACDRFYEPCELDPLPPTHYREPGYPLLLSLGIMLDPEVRAMSRAEFWPEPGRLNPQAFEALRRVNAAQIFLIAIMVFGITAVVSGSIWWAYVPAALVITSETLWHYSQFFLSEITGMLFLSSAMLCFTAAIASARIRYFVLGAMAYGALVLTKAIYYYLVIVPVVVFILALLRNRQQRKQLAKGAVVAGVIYAAIVSAWMYRNYTHFGKFEIADRGPTALATRMEFNKMTERELRASFLLWAPDRTLRKRLRTEYTKKDTTRFNRSNQDGFYRSGRRRADEVLRELGDIEGARVLKQQAIETLKSDPIKHLLVSASFFWRGMFVEDDRVLGPLKIPAYEHTLILMGGLISLFIVATLTLQPSLLLVSGLPLASIVLHSLVSNSRHRYNFPTVPMLYVCTALVIFLVISFVGRVARRSVANES